MAEKRASIPSAKLIDEIKVRTFYDLKLYRTEMMSRNPHARSAIKLYITLPRLMMGMLR